MNNKAMIHNLVKVNFSRFENGKHNEEYINYFSGRYYNFISENIVRSTKIDTLIDVLRKNNINFKIKTTRIGVWGDLSEEIILL